MKVEGATSQDVFDYLFDVGAGKFLSEKEKKYLHELFEDGISSMFNLLKIVIIIWLMIDWKTLLEMKVCKISI